MQLKHAGRRFHLLFLIRLVKKSDDPRSFIQERMNQGISCDEFKVKLQTLKFPPCMIKSHLKEEREMNMSI